MLRGRKRRRAHLPKPGLDAIVAVGIAAATLVTLYIDQDRWDVIVPLCVAVLIVYVWLTRFR
jgi:hypothetical protein